ncbi:MAG: heme-binding protein [Opitutaceae bacterium]
MAYEQAFPPTASGVNELKTLPAGVLLKSAGQGEYFDRANDLFMPLFRYISRHDIAMTVPVEARIRDAAMYVWVAESQHAKVTGSEGAVVVEKIPERRVSSRGARGSYSRANFERTRDELLAWLATRPDVEVAGEAVAIFWSGPFTPWFVKRYEVHVPVRTRAGGS